MSRRGVFGFAAAACVACCAGPFLAAIGGLTALGVAGTIAFGGAALAVAGVATVALIVIRQRRRTLPEPQRVELSPTRR